MKTFIITLALLFGALFFLGNSQSNPGERVNKIVEINIVKEKIATGGLNSEPHRTEVEIRLEYPIACQVTLWLVGGEGYGRGNSSYTHNGVTYTLPLEKPALLNGKKAGEPLVIMADRNGYVKVTLISSNLNESVRVEGRSGRHTNLSSPEASDTCTFYDGTAIVEMAPLVWGQASLVTLSLAVEEGPLEGHDVVLYVNRVVVAGQTINFSVLNPTNLQQYAEIPRNYIRQRTATDGRVRANLLISNNTDIQSVSVEARDLSIFTEGQ